MSAPRFADIEGEDLGPGALKSLGLGLTQGATAGFSDEAGAGFQSLLLALPPGLREALGGSKYDDGSTIPANYERALAENRAELHAAEKAHPEFYVPGEVAGSVATTFLPGVNVAKGAGVARTLLSGGLLGGLQGLGTSEADSAPGLARDTGVGVGAGILGGALGMGVQKAAGVVGSRLSGAAKGMLERAESKATQMGADAAAGETASARSLAGRNAQDAYRQLEHLRDLGAMTNLTPEQTAIAHDLAGELALKAQQKLIPASEAKTAAQKAFLEAAASEAERATAIASEKLKSTVGKDVWELFRSYGEPVLGAAAGTYAGDELFDSPGAGGTVGTLAGLIAGRTRAGKAIANRLGKPGNQVLMSKGLDAVGRLLGAGAEPVAVAGRAAAPLLGGPPASGLASELADAMGPGADQRTLAQVLREMPKKDDRKRRK